MVISKFDTLSGSSCGTSLREAKRSNLLIDLTNWCALPFGVLGSYIIFLNTI